MGAYLMPIARTFTIAEGERQEARGKLLWGLAGYTPDLTLPYLAAVGEAGRRRLLTSAYKKAHPLTTSSHQLTAKGTATKSFIVC